MRVKCLAQEHNTMTRPGLEPGTPDPESSALTTRPPRFPLSMSISLFQEFFFSKGANNYSGTSPLGHLQSRDKLWFRKNVHIIFVSVTSIEGTPLFSGSQSPVLTSIQRTQTLVPEKCSYNLCIRYLYSITEWTPLFRKEGHSGPEAQL